MKPRKLVVLLIILAILNVGGLGLYFIIEANRSSEKTIARTMNGVLNTTPTASPQSQKDSLKTEDDDPDLEIILALNENFESFQQQIKMEPVLGAYRFYGPLEVQFIGNNNLITGFEDGHISGVAVVNYTDTNMFTLVKEYENVSYLTIEELDEIISKYGQNGYLVKNYRRRNENWELVDYNVIVE